MNATTRRTKRFYSTRKCFVQIFLWMRSLVDEELAQKVAPENIEIVDKIDITQEGRKYESDLIYKVSIQPEAYFYILMELQPYRWMALRILNYIVRFYKNLPKNGKLPAVFPIVLYNGGSQMECKNGHIALY